MLEWAGPSVTMNLTSSVRLFDQPPKATDMRRPLVLLIFATVASCAPTGEYLRKLPEEVVAIAAPNQNLQAVKLLEDDGCYWYEHDGPVETTLLPLVSKGGQHICIQRQS